MLIITLWWQQVSDVEKIKPKKNNATLAIKHREDMKQKV